MRLVDRLQRKLFSKARWEQATRTASPEPADCIASVAAGHEWPREPYKGLDFYRSYDRKLFREREKDVLDCARLLTSYGTKILLLHGPSGAGKSSFLRAGLIPHLKERTDQLGFCFLPKDDGVIRCTSDPVRAIAAKLSTALAEGVQFFRDRNPAGPYPDGFPGSRPRPDLSAEARALLAARQAPSQTLIEAVLNALTLVRRALPGTLLLVIDQGEEVLTHVPSSADDSRLFFLLLEEIYLRNLDIRIVVSLRTEYYGRFRNLLRIRDRLEWKAEEEEGKGKKPEPKPEDNGVELYFLLPLRNPEELRSAITWPAENGEHKYGFTFEPGLVERIVKESLSTYPASVTPGLQLICASLVELQPVGEINEHTYKLLGGLEGIVGAYLNKAIRLAVLSSTHTGEVLRSASAAAIGCSSRRWCRRIVEWIESLRLQRQMWWYAERWWGLLAAMVSDQGGGVVASIARSEVELTNVAKRIHLRGDVPAGLSALSVGRFAVLRMIDEQYRNGEEDEIAPSKGAESLRPIYILKHDTLAISLARWNVTQKAIRQEKKQKIILAASLLTVVVIGIVGYVSYSREVIAQRNSAVILKNAIFEEAPTGDFRTSLVLLLANLNQVEKPINFYDRAFPSGIREATLAILRRTLVRAPWFTGQYQAVGIDPVGNRIALLGGRQLDLLKLPLNQKGTNPIIETFPLPPPYRNPPSALDNAQPAVGFIKDIGPAAYLTGRIIFWDDAHIAHTANLWIRLLAPLLSGGVFVNFYDGAAWVTQFVRAQGVNRLDVLTFGKSELKAGGDYADLRKPMTIVERRIFGALPIFSNSSALTHQKYGYVDRSRLVPKYEQTLPLDHQFEARKLPADTQMDELDFVLRRADNVAASYGRVALEKIFPIGGGGGTGQGNPLIAFAGNADAFAFKPEGATVYIYDLNDTHVASDIGYLEPRITEIISGDVLRGKIDARARAATMPFLAPPFAIAKVGKRWRAAWLDSRGVEVVQSGTDAESSPGAMKSTAFSVRHGPLMTGELGGIKLDFVGDGRFLVLQQQEDFGSQIDVRIWDLSEEWEDFIESGETGETSLRSLACEILHGAASNTTLISAQRALFQIPAADMPLCP